MSGTRPQLDLAAAAPGSAVSEAAASLPRGALLGGAGVLAGALAGEPAPAAVGA